MFDQAEKELQSLRASISDLTQVIAALSQTVTAQNTIFASMRERLAALEGKAPAAPVPSVMPLALPKITAASTTQGVEMTRVIAVMPPGWTPFQGRWYVGDKEIGGKASQTSKDVPEGQSVIYREWFRHEDGRVEIVSSLPFGPITGAVVVSGESTLR